MEMRIHYDVINIKCTCDILKFSGAQIKFRMNNGITLILFINKTSLETIWDFFFVHHRTGHESPDGE